jgi:hypothetical protein
VFKKLQNIFFNRKLGKTTQNAVRPQIHLIPFSEAKYIGLIVGSHLLGKDIDVLKDILQLFDNHSKTYFFIALCDEKKFPESLLGVPHVLISKKDLLYGGVPSAKVLKKLKNNNFNILIDMNQSANRTAFFIEATATSTLRIGKADVEREPFVDLMIEWRDTDNALQFLENIIFYLSMLTKGK